MNPPVPLSEQVAPPILRKDFKLPPPFDSLPDPSAIAGPQPSPMMSPDPKQGLQAASKVEIQQAIQLLKKQLDPNIYPPMSEPWECLESCIKKLSKQFGTEESDDLSQAGLRQIASALSPKGLEGIMGGGGGGGQPMAGPSPMSILGGLGG